MQGQKDINASKLQSSFTVFLGVFCCIYPLSHTVVNIDARSHEWITYYASSCLNFPRVWRTIYSGFLKVSWAFTSLSTYFQLHVYKSNKDTDFVCISQLLLIFNIPQGVQDSF